MSTKPLETALDRAAGWFACDRRLHWPALVCKLDEWGSDLCYRRIKRHGHDSFVRGMVSQPGVDDRA